MTAKKTKPMTSAQRQKLFRDNKTRAGKTREEYWATKEGHKLLKQELSRVEALNPAATENK